MNVPQIDSHLNEIDRIYWISLQQILKFQNVKRRKKKKNN